MKKNSFSYEQLIECAKGILFGKGNAQLPLPPMLMFDRIININENGGDFAATATFSQYSGSAVETVDYIWVTPPTAAWANQETGIKTFVVKGINSWGTGSTLNVQFDSYTNIVAGEETTTTINIVNTNTADTTTDPFPPISTDGTINNYRNAPSSRRNKGAVPFSYGIRTPFSLRGRTSAYSGSDGGQKI